MTNEELLNAWNAGNEVTAVEMGGLGPDYEQAIYVLAFLFLTELLKEAPDFDNVLKVKARVNQIGSLSHIAHALDKIGPTGAMVYVAWNVAMIFARLGYESAMAKAPADRVIKVSKISPDDFIKKGF